MTEPTDRDKELALEAHCRYCTWIDAEPKPYDTVMKCKGDLEDAAEAFALARTEGRAEVIAKVRQALTPVRKEHNDDCLFCAVKDTGIDKVLALLDKIEGEK